MAMIFDRCMLECFCSLSLLIGKSGEESSSLESLTPCVAEYDAVSKDMKPGFWNSDSIVTVSYKMWNNLSVSLSSASSHL